jgi:aspartate aminotransferase
MMWFSSPCNPSGSVYIQREELTALAKVLENILTSLWLQMKSTSTSISQELLQHCIYPRNVRKTVTVNGVAKAFADGELVILEHQNSSLKRKKTKVK